MSPPGKQKKGGNKMMDFSGKVVLVTGAGAGIGEATALAFAAQGAVVGVNARSERTSGRVAEKILAGGGDAAALPGDVSEEAQACALVEKAVERWGRLDILVNNAGIVPQGTVLDVSVEEWDRGMAVNARGVFLMSKYAVLQMRKQGGGVIVNNASVAALKGLRNRAAYAAGKGAVVALTKAMAMDHIDEKIRVNCICPGTVLTPSLQARIDTAPDPVSEMRMYAGRQPIGRLGTPEEIAEGILFLASNTFLTGAVIAVDGALSL